MILKWFEPICSENQIDPYFNAIKNIEGEKIGKKWTKSEKIDKITPIFKF